MLCVETPRIEIKYRIILFRSTHFAFSLKTRTFVHCLHSALHLPNTHTHTCTHKITPKLWRFQSKILLNDFGFWDFSTPPRHVDMCGKIPNPSKSLPGGLWRRQNVFLPTCYKGLHDHLRSVMSMHFWRFFYFFEFFCIFWVNWTIFRSSTVEKILTIFWWKLLQNLSQSKSHET